MKTYFSLSGLMALVLVACGGGGSCPSADVQRSADTPVTGTALCDAIAADARSFVETRDHYTYPAGSPVSYCELCPLEFNECGAATLPDGTSIDEQLQRLATATGDAGAGARWCDELAATPVINLNCRKVGITGGGGADCPEF